MESPAATDADLLAGFSRRVGAARSWVLKASNDDVLSLVRQMAEGEGASLIWCTSLGGSPIRCDDVKALVARLQDTAGEKGLLVCDNSLATSFGCAAVRLGADVVVESLARAAGEKDLCVVSLSQRAAGMGWLVSAIDGMPVPDERAIARVSVALEGFDARRRRENDNAQVVAAYLRCHPRVREVVYPGIKGDPSHEVAARQLQNGFGPCADYAVAGGRQSGDGAFVRVTCDDGDPFVLVGGLEERLRG